MPGVDSAEMVHLAGRHWGCWGRGSIEPLSALGVLRASIAKSLFKSAFEPLIKGLSLHLICDKWILGAQHCKVYLIQAVFAYDLDALIDIIIVGVEL